MDVLSINYASEMTGQQNYDSPPSGPTSFWLQTLYRVPEIALTDPISDSQLESLCREQPRNGWFEINGIGGGSIGAVDPIEAIATLIAALNDSRAAVAGLDLVAWRAAQSPQLVDALANESLQRLSGVTFSPCAAQSDFCRTAELKFGPCGPQMTYVTMRLRAAPPDPRPRTEPPPYVAPALEDLRVRTGRCVV